MKIANLKPEEQAHVLKKVKELQKTDGWVMLQQIMASEREDVFRKLAAPNASTAPEVIHYHRGIVEGTYRLQELPDRIVHELETHLKIHEAMSKSQPTT